MICLCYNDFMEKSLKTLEFDKVLFELSNYATTDLGKERCLNAKVFSESEKIKDELIFTREAKQILEESSFKFTTIYDLKTYFDLNKSTFDIDIICAFRKSLREFRITKTFFEKSQKTLLTHLVGQIVTNKELEEEIDKIITDDFQIKQNASPELKSLFQTKKDINQNLKQTINSLLNNTDFQKYLQENIWTTRDDRVVFQVKAENKNKIDGIVHDVSSTSQTYYIEPKQLVSLNNKIRETELRINAEISRLLKLLTDKITLKKDEIIKSNDILIEIDFILAKARYAIKNKFCEPEIATDKVIILEQVKNPILIKYCENIVPNNFEIGKDYISMILTGSNTGGKTVLLKTIGLCVLMMKSGFYIPAAYGKIYPYKKIYADIGDEQSIEQSLSSFSSHIKNVSYILANSDEDSLVLLDELCSGTDPKEGSALAQAILKQLTKNGIINVVTTHYSEMKSMAFSNKNFQNACVEFDLNTLKPTYKLLIGIPGASNAINIAKNMDISSEIIDCADEIMNKQNDNSAKILTEIQEIRNKLTKQEQENEILKEQTKKIKEEYERELEKFKSERKKQIKDFKNKYNIKLIEAKNEIKTIIDEVRRTKSEKITRRAYSRLSNIESENRNDLNSQEKEFSSENEYIDIDWSKAKIGDKVIVKDMNQIAELSELPDKKGNLYIKIGIMNMKVKKEKLAQFEEKFVAKPKKQPSNRIERFEFERISLSQTLDLRGYRCEDALCELENYLDKASLYGLSPVYIIHGHGTGILKQAVRDFVKTSPYVIKFRIGEPSEGGDGVIVIDVK